MLGNTNRRIVPCWVYAVTRFQRPNLWSRRRGSGTAGGSAGEKGALGDDVDLGLTAPTPSRNSRAASGEGEASRRHGGRAVDGGGVEFDGKGTEGPSQICFLCSSESFSICCFHSGKTYFVLNSVYAAEVLVCVYKDSEFRNILLFTCAMNSML